MFCLPPSQLCAALHSALAVFTPHPPSSPARTDEPLMSYRNPFLMFPALFLGQGQRSLGMLLCPFPCWD